MRVIDSEPTMVLVIDGDTVRRGMLACTLPPSAYVVEFAKTVEAGLDLLGRLRPLVVVVGLDDSTADLCQRIRQLPAGDDCLVVVMDERLSEAMDPDVAGADVALPFPFELAVFEDQLESHRRRAQTVTRQLPSAREEGSDSDPSLPELELRDPDAEVPGDAQDEAAAWDSFAARVLQFHLRLAELDYFQLLEVRRGASLAEIKDAYFQRSMEFHPDRFIRLEDEELRVRIYEVYKRMTEAFRVLTQPAVRAAYEQEDLDAPGDSRSLRYRGGGTLRGTARPPWSQANTATGCRYLRFAELAHQAGNFKSAKMYLELAVQWEPGNEALRRKLEEVAGELR